MRSPWKLKPNGDFDIRSFYNKLRGSPSVVFPWKGLWRVKAPQSIFSFSFGLLLGIESFQVITRDLGALILWIGALCVIIVGRQWINYYFIVRRLIGCEVLFLHPLEFRGSYLEQFQIYFLARGIGWQSTRLTSGI